MDTGGSPRTNRGAVGGGLTTPPEMNWDPVSLPEKLGGGEMTMVSA